MKLVVACRCGQHFATHRRHRGKTVPCPACGSALTIENSSHVQPPPVPQGIRVLCPCGWAFNAPAAYEGQAVACPGCHSAVTVPSSDPLAVGSLTASPQGSNRAWLQPQQQVDGFTDQLAIRLAYLAGGSVALLALAIAVTAIVNSFVRTPSHVQATDVTSPSSAAAKLPSQPQAAANMPPPPPADAAAESQASSAAPTEAPAPAQAPASEPAPATGTIAAAFSSGQAKASIVRPTSRAAASLPSTSPGEPATSRLPDAAVGWIEQPEARLFGIRRVGSLSNPAANFSWLTSLLPYLDHQDVYKRIDFNQPVTSGKNLSAGATVIPEFVNPHEERQRWKGFPLDGLALTHFAGMSGVEDSRNVVAAKLPRSDPRAGVFGYDEVARPADITDGTSQTIMIVGTGSMANPWILGGGGTIRGAREPLFDNVTGLGMKGMAGGGTLAVMADGSVRQVSSKVDPRVFKAMSTIHGAETVDLNVAAPSVSRDVWKASPRPTSKPVSRYRPVGN